MKNTETKGECINCGGNKRICPFSMNKWRGKKDSVTGFYVAHVESKDENSCILYAGFMTK